MRDVDRYDKLLLVMIVLSIVSGAAVYDVAGAWGVGWAVAVAAILWYAAVRRP